MPGGSTGILLEGVVGRGRPGAARVRFRDPSGEAGLRKEVIPMLFRELISRETGLSADEPAYARRAKPAEVAACGRSANGSVPARPARGGTLVVPASSRAQVSGLCVAVQRHAAARGDRPGRQADCAAPDDGGRKGRHGFVWLREGVTRSGCAALVTTERRQGGNVLRRKDLCGLRPSSESNLSGDESARVLLFPQRGYAPAGLGRDSVAVP